MVTAIVIPILIFYFYWITKKEKARKQQIWETLEEVRLEARVKGKIIHINTVKKNFYHQFYMMVTSIQVKNGDICHLLILKQPLMESWVPPSLKTGDEIQALGKWEGTVFLVGDIIVG